MIVAIGFDEHLGAPSGGDFEENGIAEAAPTSRSGINHPIVLSRKGRIFRKVFYREL